MSTTRLALITAALLLCLTLSFGCSSNEQRSGMTRVIAEHRSTDVWNTIVDQLNDNQVVLLGDFGHLNFTYKEGVLKTLDAWFQRVTHDADTPARLRHLTLMLERDSMMMRQTIAYARSHDFKDIFDPRALAYKSTTLAHLEFAWRLGDMLRRIDDYNATCPEPDHLRLSLFGPEQFINDPHWTYAKRDHYFVYERDSLTALNIANYVQRHPDEPILGFYGSAHLQRGIVPKDGEEIVADGKFLATYLDSLYPGRVVTVGQVMPGFYKVMQDRFTYGDSTYILNTAASDPKTHAILAGSFDFDFAVVRPWQYATSPFLRRIPSMNLIQLSVAAMPEVEDTSADSYVLGTWRGLLFYFYTISSVTPHRMNPADPAARVRETRKWKDWLAHADMNIVPDVVSLRVWTRLLDSLLVGGHDVGFRLSQVGSLMPREDRYLWTDTTRPSTEVAQDLRNYITANRDDLVTTALIGILWVGNDAERASAQKALVEMTGETYTDPADWSAWWRHQ